MIGDTERVTRPEIVALPEGLRLPLAVGLVEVGV
jgi:hypothetical protein